MPSITSWTRLEPRCRDADMARTVSARIYDPLWMLARQWQTGEFLGEDTGTPVIARVRATTTQVTRCHLGELPANTQTQAAAYDSTTMPLEVLVERQRVRPTSPNDASKLRLVAEAGLHFLRMLEQQPLSKSYRDAFIAAYALVMPSETELAPLDGASAGYIATMAGRVPDARRLAEVFRSGAPLDPALNIAVADRAEVELAAQRWLAWYDTIFSEPAGDGKGAWLPERLEYAVSVSGRLSPDPFDERTLTASEVYEGEVDWTDFDLDFEVNLGTQNDRAFTSITETTVPAPITFRGAPATRFWEFEDAQIDFGLMPVGPGDLAHMLMIEYAASYGNDWFVVPLDLHVGSLTSIRSLVVTDTFGVRSLLRPIGDRTLPRPNWSMFQLSYLRRAGAEGLRGSEANLLFLPPSLGRKLNGAPLEEVLFMRDEMANLAWAIERAVESPLETALRRGDPASPEPSPAAIDEIATLPRYRLSSEVPAHWIPLLPVQLKSPANTVLSRLKRGAVLKPDGSMQVYRARGRVLNFDPQLLLHDEEVPREGVRVLRHYQLARWLDGNTFCWIGQRKTVGRGEGSSGLRFDRIEAARGAEPAV
jgi:hypothetical protein